MYVLWLIRTRMLPLSTLPLPASLATVHSSPARAHCSSRDSAMISTIKSFACSVHTGFWVRLLGFPLRYVPLCDPAPGR